MLRTGQAYELEEDEQKSSRRIETEDKKKFNCLKS